MTVRRAAPSRQGSCLELPGGTRQAVAGARAVADRRARPAGPHAAPPADPRRTRRADRHLETHRGESVRRLAERGLIVDTGERTPGGRGRGRVGSYYALAAGVGTALAVSIAPEGVVAECVDAYGDTTARAERTISRPAQPADVAAALHAVAGEVRQAAGGTPRLAVVSAADPVDRATGRLVPTARRAVPRRRTRPGDHRGGTRRRTRHRRQRRELGSPRRTGQQHRDP